MDDRSIDPRHAPARPLTAIAWLAAAVIAVMVWTTVGFFVLMPIGAAIPLGDPAQVPMWLAYAGLTFLMFAWPLLLFIVTQRLTALNRALMVVYALGALAIQVTDGLVIFTHSMDSALQRALAAVLILAAVGLNVLVGKRVRRP
ncbi:MAG: hypothetical protein JXP37_05130 [Coriobacteriia bacterium]|nr:hypothetical protein [Coriobacteriia bacterium]